MAPTDLALLDVVGGLPVHVLAVHAAVVAVPVSALLTAAVALVPRWRAAAWPAVAVSVVALVTALVAKESGEAFQARLGGQVALEHGERGALLPLVVAGLVAASVLLALVRTRAAGLRVAASVLAVVAAVGALGWTVVTGHSGSESVWGDVVRATEPAPPAG